jgi:secreted trypsin-like serine protease
VLTAAHCVSSDLLGTVYDPSAFRVKLGSNKLDAGTAYAVDTVRRAPAFNEQTLQWDAALLHLTAAAPQMPMALITSATAASASVGAVGRVVGWGTTSEKSDVAQALQQVDVPIVADSTCSASYSSQYDAATMLCAGYAQGGRDACQGDSGGPLMVDVDPSVQTTSYRLAGIVSSGDGCAEPGRYGLYTRLANATTRGWIAAVTGDAGIADPQPTATPTSTVAPVTSEPQAKAVLRLSSTCTSRTCHFRVTFAAGGSYAARVTITRTVARKLHLTRRTLVTRGGTYDTAGTASVGLTIPAKVRHAMSRRHLRTVAARLGVTARTSDGQRTNAHRTVTLRR